MAAGGGHGKKAVIAALIANAGIAVAKFVGFLITRSSAMLAESIHSLADAGNQGLLLYGAAVGGRPADERHPFGYGRARYFWAFVVAIVLFSLGALFSLYEGLEKLRHPHELDSPLVAIGILSVAILLEMGSIRVAIREAQAVKGQESWWSFIRHSKSAELPVVLLEDAGALIGLVLALAGVTLTAVTHDAMWDAIGTLSIAALLGVIAVVLAVEMQSLLIGEAASPAQIALIRERIAGVPAIGRVIDLRTVHLGPEDIMVSVKAAMAPDLSVAEAARAIDEAEAAVRQAVPEARVIFIEPMAGEPREIA